MSVTFDPFVKFRQPEIAERQIDTLIGLCKGVVADGVVNQVEAEVLRNWLAANEITVRSNPVTYALLERVDGMLRDDHLDAEESAELLHALRTFTGETPARGEFIPSTDLPLDSPAPRIMFEGRSFMCTGTFAFGTREQCKQQITDRGGMLS